MRAEAMVPDARAARTGAPSERRLTAEYVAARVLVDATTFDEAAPKILEAICSNARLGARRAVDRRPRGRRAAVRRDLDRSVSAISRVRRSQPPA